MKSFCLNLALSLLGALLLFSCSPSINQYAYEMRKPSKSGVDFYGKSAAVVYYDNLNVNDLFFESALAQSFLQQYNLQFPSLQDSSQVYAVARIDSLSQLSKEAAVEMLVQTGKDVLILMGAPKFENGNYLQPILIYDSFDKNDQLLEFEAKGKIADDSAAAAYKIGRGIASSFAPQWKEELFSIISFEGMKWIEAEEYAASCQWKKAMSVWMSFLDRKDATIRSAAEYNIALACYMCGMNELAKEWLDRSDADMKFSCSSSLRKKMNR